MKVPCCSVCQTRYNEEERVPLLLHCGHGFCNDCLSKMFSSSPDNTLICPRCRHVSVVGNSVLSLRKNFAILSLIRADGDEDDEDDDEEEEIGIDGIEGLRNGPSSRASSSSSGCGIGGSSVIDLGTHELRLVRKIGEGRKGGVRVWEGRVLRGAGKCRHRVAVRRVLVGEEDDVVWMMRQLEGLRRDAMWCRNVCTFHGVMRVDGESLCLVMDRCYGSVLSEIQRNGGRLTLEQILRLFIMLCFFVSESSVDGLWCWCMVFQK